MNNYRKVKMTIMGKKYNLLIANTHKKKKLGMKIFNEVPPNTGMIFTYSKPVKHSFTMVGVKFPLVIMFFDSRNNLIDVFDCRPGQKNIMPRKEFSYVIEIPKR